MPVLASLVCELVHIEISFADDTFVKSIDTAQFGIDQDVMTRQSVPVARACPEAQSLDADNMLSPCVPGVGTDSYMSIDKYVHGSVGVARS